jgi:cytochrome c biogenesis protein CcmG, thiol:disulfide interchange protein DsbE
MIAQEHDDKPPAAREDAVTARRWLPAGVRTMSRRAKIVSASTVAVVVVAVALVLAAAGGSAPKAAPPRVAKSFSLPRLGQPGSTVSLASYAGQPVIVNFFASWCQPCQKETPLLAGYYASHAGHVNLIGIDANDQQAAALRFVAKAGVSYPVASDPFPAAVTTSYGVYALPQTFFLNADHQIVAQAMGAVTARVLAKDVALMNKRPSQNRG